MQIFLYGNGLRSYILAVVVPSEGADPATEEKRHAYCLWNS